MAHTPFSFTRKRFPEMFLILKLIHLGLPLGAAAPHAQEIKLNASAQAHLRAHLIINMGSYDRGVTKCAVELTALVN